MAKREASLGLVRRRSKGLCSPGDLERVSPPDAAFFEEFAGHQLEAGVEARDHAGVGAIRVGLRVEVKNFSHKVTRPAAI